MGKDELQFEHVSDAEHEARNLRRQVESAARRLREVLGDFWPLDEMAQKAADEIKRLRQDVKEHQGKARRIGQALIEEIGASGPEDAEVTALRAAKEIKEQREQAEQATQVLRAVIGTVGTEKVDEIARRVAQPLWLWGRALRAISRMGRDENACWALPEARNMASEVLGGNTYTLKAWERAGEGIPVAPRDPPPREGQLKLYERALIAIAEMGSGGVSMSPEMGNLAAEVVHGRTGTLDQWEAKRQIDYPPPPSRWENKSFDVDDGTVNQDFDPPPPPEGPGFRMVDQETVLLGPLGIARACRCCGVLVRGGESVCAWCLSRTAGPGETKR